nr:coiled-coil domain-containing protein 81-like [Anas platyrhynchos]
MGVTVPGLGTFFAVKQEQPMAGVKLLDAKKPVFQVSEHFANVHGLPYKKETFPGTTGFSPGRRQLIQQRGQGGCR